MTYSRVNIGALTQKQLKAAAAGKPISLTAAQVAGSGTTFHTHPENAKKIANARKKHTGTRIQIMPGAIDHDMNVMQGGSIWSWLSKAGTDVYKFGKKTWNDHKDVIKPVLSRIADVGVPMLATSMLGDPTAAAPMRGLLKSMTGIGVKGRLVKGSAEAKAHMAAIRQRKKAKGSGIILT